MVEIGVTYTTYTTQKQQCFPAGYSPVKSIKWDKWYKWNNPIGMRVSEGAPAGYVQFGRKFGATCPTYTTTGGSTLFLALSTPLRVMDNIASHKPRPLRHSPATPTGIARWHRTKCMDTGEGAELFSTPITLRLKLAKVADRKIAEIQNSKRRQQPAGATQCHNVK